MPEKYIQYTSTDGEKNIGTNYIDLACSLLGGKILSCSDEFFAEADNLIKREKPVRDSSRFTDRGAWYDGWETRRHNQSYDWVIIKLAFAGTIDAFDIDTSYFNGNHSPSANVEGCHSPDKDPVPGDDTFWNEILPRVDLGPSASHYFKVQNSRQCYTHVKLNIYPDGGVARFRVYGNVRPIWPSDKTASIDLAFIGNGGKVVSCSDQHYGAKDNILLPGRGKDMSDGWETKRSRVPGHCDWAIVRLGAPGYLKDAEIDTAYFKGNFPDSVMLEGCFSDLEIPDDTTEWENILPQSKLGPDKQHYFRLKKTHWQFSHVKMTMYPDGGIKRLRLFGQLAMSLTNNGVTNGHSVSSHNTPPSYEITAAPLTSDQFAAYGQVIEAFAESNLNSPFAMSITRGIRVTPANQGTARKYNHIAKAVNFRQSAMTQDGKLIAKAEQNICLYHCQPTTEFPFKVKLLERHLYSSQAFIPLSSGSNEGYLVIVCLNGQDDKPDLSTLRVFIGSSNQGINYHPGIWHHPMVALEQVTDFVCLVHESGVPEEDCEEVALDDNVTIKLPEPIDYNN